MDGVPNARIRELCGVIKVFSGGSPILKKRGRIGLLKCKVECMESRSVGSTVDAVD